MYLCSENLLLILESLSIMEMVFRICLFIAGLINFAPFILVFAPDKMMDSYGINVSDPNVMLLLRHRAILFGIVGGIMIWAAVSKCCYPLAITIGFVSMISFLVLSKFVDGGINPALQTVFKLDIVGILVLLVGSIICGFYVKN